MFSEIFNDKDFQMQAKQMRSSAQILEYLTKTHGMNENIIDDVYNYAKFNYEIGNYDECFEWLVRLGTPTPKKESILLFLASFIA